MGYEMPAVRIERPLKKPPEKYRDPSEFKGAEKRTTLEAVREKAEKATTEEALKQADLWKEERKQREKQIERWADNFMGLTPQAVAHKLEQQFAEAEKNAANKKGLLSDVSEALYHLRNLETRDNPFVKDIITGIEEFLEDQTVMVSHGAKETWKKLQAEEQARQKSAKRANYAREMPAFKASDMPTQPDMTAVTHQKQEWFDKGDRGEIEEAEEDTELPGGIKLRGGAGVKWSK